MFEELSEKEERGSWVMVGPIKESQKKVKVNNINRRIKENDRADHEKKNGSLEAKDVT